MIVYISRLLVWLLGHWHCKLLAELLAHASV